MTYNQRLPADVSLLPIQQKHVTKAIWEGNERLRRPRRHAIYCMKHNDRLDDCVKTLIHHAGFGQFLTLTHIEINHHLITALVERWRTGTHTFHLLLGEATVTLEDVAVQLGLPIDGEPITGVSSSNLITLCGHLLYFVPPETAYKGNSIKLTWLNNEF